MITITITLTRDLCRLLDINDQDYLKNEFNAFIQDLKDQNEIDEIDFFRPINDLAELPCNEKISLQFKDRDWAILFEADSLILGEEPLTKTIPLNKHGRKIISDVISSYPELQGTL